MTANHAGKWTCAGKLLDSNEIDLYDYITLKIDAEIPEGTSIWASFENISDGLFLTRTFFR